MAPSLRMALLNKNGKRFWFGSYDENRGFFRKYAGYYDESFNDHFYTIEKIRKLKLEKINEITYK